MPAFLSGLLNALGLYAIAALLAAAFAMQFALGELPCPLCMMQRAMFCALAVGPILNLRHGPRASHYALSMLAALVGLVIATRQVFLHILPGDPGYGSAVMGLHYYTWAALVFGFALIALAVLLLFDGQLGARAGRPGVFASLAVWLVIGLAAANLLSTLAMCGFAECADDPVSYRLLDALTGRTGR